MGEECQKLRAVTINKDDVLAGIAPTRDMMIDSPGEFKTKRTYHGTEISKKRLPTPLFHDLELLTARDWRDG
jgi:hypothetical protein